MRFKRTAGAVAFVLASAVSGNALAASCFDLWYERNSIYDENGYCFATEMAQEYFDNDDCWTKHPSFSRAEQRRIDVIRAEEKRRRCKVN